MRLIVTGHKGYVGPVFARQVADLRLGWEVVGIDAEFFAAQLTGPDPAQYFRREIRADVRELSDDVLRGADAVVYLAAVSNDPMGMEFEAATLQINADATAATAARCRALGIRRFVFASSCSIYGAAGPGARRESDPLNPLTAYARSKVEAEKRLRPLAGDGLSITCLRFATACGVSPRLRLDLVLNDFVASAVQAGRIDVLSDGSPWRPLIHVEDMARAIEWALIRDGDPFLAVNVGSQEWTWQIGNLARDVACVLGSVDVSINKEAEPDNRSYRVDFSLFRHLAPRHQPKKQFATAVSELWDQIGRIDFRGQPFRKSPYLRLNVLRAMKATNEASSDLRWITENPVDLVVAK